MYRRFVLCITAKWKVIYQQRSTYRVLWEFRGRRDDFQLTRKRRVRKGFVEEVTFELRFEGLGHVDTGVGRGGHSRQKKQLHEQRHEEY